MRFIKIFLLSLLVLCFAPGPGMAYHDSVAVSDNFIFCHHCRQKNPIHARRCISCKIKLFGSPCSHCNTLIRPGHRYCPHCNTDSRKSKPRRKVQVPCVKCKELYDPALKACPHCNGHGEHSTSKKYQKTFLDNDCLVGEFTKSDYKKYIMRESIDTFTAHQSFSKVIVICAVDQYPVIVNTIKTYKNGKQLRTKTFGKRLKPGRNVIPLNITKGTSELVLSFDHGKDCGVQVYLE